MKRDEYLHIACVACSGGFHYFKKQSIAEALRRAIDSGFRALDNADSAFVSVEKCGDGRKEWIEIHITFGGICGACVSSIQWAAKDEPEPPDDKILH